MSFCKDEPGITARIPRIGPPLCEISYHKSPQVIPPPNSGDLPHDFSFFNCNWSLLSGRIRPSTLRAEHATAPHHAGAYERRYCYFAKTWCRDNTHQFTMKGMSHEIQRNKLKGPIHRRVNRGDFFRLLNCKLVCANETNES